MNLMYYLFSVSVASQHCIKEETQKQSLINKEMQLEVCLRFLLLSIHWQIFISYFLSFHTRVVQLLSEHETVPNRSELL